MSSESKKILASAIVRLLRPLIRILLRSGTPYGTFAELAKWVYVDVASKEFVIPGKKQTTSRVAIITGLSRKEVKRISGIVSPDDMGAVDRYNRASRVLSGWIKDPRFLDDKGIPRELPLEGEEGSFASLVKAYSGDIPTKALLDEMLRIGMVELASGRIRLLSRGYIVKRGEAEKITILGMDVAELIKTIDHNIVSAPSEAFLQRKVVYDNIPEEVLPELRKKVVEMGQECIESVDRVIAQYDRDVNPSVQGRGEQRAGLAVFYFE
ncbi:MAG: DUF6502 family protein [Thermodesulfobacteriota bacterium]